MSLAGKRSLPQRGRDTEENQDWKEGMDSLWTARLQGGWSAEEAESAEKTFSVFSASGYPC
jgi:hypothetical protein